MRIARNPAPDLIRGLRLRRSARVPERGPGSGPGRGLPLINHRAPELRHGTFRLHHGIASLWSDLHWQNREPCCARGRTSGRFVCTYRAIQYPHAGLVRSTRRFRNQPAKGTHHQTLAARLEKCPDRRAQSKLARCDRAHYSLAESTSSNERSRVKPGTGIPLSSGSRT